MNLNNLGSNEDYDRRDQRENKFYVDDGFNAPVERRYTAV